MANLEVNTVPPRQQQCDEEKCLSPEDRPYTPSVAFTTPAISRQVSHESDCRPVTADSDIHILSQSTPQRIRAYLAQPIPQDHVLEIQLLLLTFATGILDATTFANYGLFTSKQTGNVICLALLAVQHSAVVGAEQNIATSIGCFIIGAILFGHFGNMIGQNRRGWLIISSFISSIFVFAAAAIRYWASSAANGPAALGIIALLSIASAAQVALALCVKMPELNTTMVTGAIIQLCVDKDFFKFKNAARNRRLLFVGSLLGGSFVGSIVSKFTNPTLAILLTAIIKFSVTIALLTNRGLIDNGMPLKPGSLAARSEVTLRKIIWD